VWDRRLAARAAEVQAEEAAATTALVCAPDSGLRVRYDTFWAAYPKKFGHEAAWREWQALAPSPALTAQMLDALVWQTHQDTWVSAGGRYVPHPATWLRDRRWEDEEPCDRPRLNRHTVALLRCAEEFLNS
jgi:hypothetical protein